MCSGSASRWYRTRALCSVPRETRLGTNGRSRRYSPTLSSAPTMGSRSHPVVLFDGACSFCDASVQFVIDHDPRARFRFAPLQSAVGAQLAARAGVDVAALDTLVLVDDAHSFVRSDAVIEIARRLGRPWSALTVARLLPRTFRDAAYRLVARHRMRFFGRRDACRIPTPELRARFLDS